jgi:hypothetical protein
VRDAGVEKDALGRGRLSGIDVGHDAEIAVAIDWSGTSHCIVCLCGHPFPIEAAILAALFNWFFYQR